MNIILYSQGCPKCKILETKLERKNINYTMIDDIDEITKYGEAHGIMSAPILEVDGVAMDFVTANKWVNGVNV